FGGIGSRPAGEQRTPQLVHDAIPERWIGRRTNGRQRERRSDENRAGRGAPARSENKFARLCAAAPDAIVSGDEDENVVFWNASTQTMFGYTEEEIAGKPWAMLVAAHDRERFADPERWMRRTTRQFTGIRRDGSEF